MDAYIPVESGQGKVSLQGSEDIEQVIFGFGGEGVAGNAGVSIGNDLLGVGVARIMGREGGDIDGDTRNATCDTVCSLGAVGGAATLASSDMSRTVTNTISTIFVLDKHE